MRASSGTRAPKRSQPCSSSFAGTSAACRRHRRTRLRPHRSSPLPLHTPPAALASTYASCCPCLCACLRPRLRACQHLRWPPPTSPHATAPASPLAAASSCSDGPDGRLLPSGSPQAPEARGDRAVQGERGS
ncbi:hypothetical protein PVAP13_2KG322967 [Panicum virgatum]|uniref:Uncharacterized protein n=1 Tax=Panicum virgatum TaxID=38727 RepID=A0A8T0WEU0_PANVG|nr:hypothetical protein PVAP13_2KG322967 [Panicum virgatum]